MHMKIYGWIIISVKQSMQTGWILVTNIAFTTCIMKPAMHSCPLAECPWFINFSVNFNDIRHRAAHMKFWDLIIIAPTLSVTPTILVVNIYNVFDGLLYSSL